MRDRTVYIVDVHGHIVAYPTRGKSFRGRTSHPLRQSSKQVTELPQELRATETTAIYLVPGKDSGSRVEMIGTYSTIPELRWAVIAQRSLDNAPRGCRREAN